MIIRNAIKWILILTVTLVAIYNYYPEPKLASNYNIDSLVVYKSTRQLMAFSGGQLIKTYKISLGRNPIGDKQFEGDKRTPEGIYYINSKNAHSGYHKNLGISYPNQQDIETSQKLNKPPGGDIKIHGLRNGLEFIAKLQRWHDWTAGCIALTNQEVDELYNAVPIGTKIEIRP